MTLRENTERPITITESTNRIVHIDTAGILKHYNQIKSANYSAKGKIPKFWDGKAAQRIAKIIFYNAAHEGVGTDDRQ